VSYSFRKLAQDAYADFELSSFHIFFHQLDNFNTDYFLWVTAEGMEASYERTDRGLGEKPIPKALEAELGDEADGVQEVEN
jgi:tRNA pseudouridine38-40 synthase